MIFRGKNQPWFGIARAKREGGVIGVVWKIGSTFFPRIVLRLF